MSLSVGERLKSARETRKVSLEEACRVTKIQRQTLEAIEEGRVQEMLDPAYARIFVKKYATYLGLDGATVVDEYEGLERRLAIAEPPPQPLTFKPPVEKPPSHRGGLGFLVPAGVVGVALIGIGFLGYLVVDLVHNLKQERPSAAVTAPAREKKAPAPELLVPLSKPLRLTLQTSADVWIQVKVDGTIIFQNVLSKGARETWTAKNHLELWTGNAGAMQLFLNGKPLEGLGRGVRKGVKITRAGIEN